MLIFVNSGRPRGVTSCHVAPPSRVRCTSPSSLPAQISPFTSGDSATANAMAYHSVPVMSPWIGPPLRPSVRGSARERSGEIFVHELPPFVLLKTYCAAVYSVDFSCGEKKRGKVHAKRYGTSLAGQPSKLSSATATFRSRLVR